MKKEVERYGSDGEEIDRQAVFKNWAELL